MSNNVSKYNYQYTKDNYDRVTVLLPKGMKAQISRVPHYESINSFINAAIVEKLEREKEDAASRFVQNIIDTFESTWTNKKWDQFTDERKAEFIYNVALAVAEEIQKRK